MDKVYILWYLNLCAAVLPAFYGGMATAKVCDGPCPTTCEAKYTHITMENIANFSGCEIVLGQITIVRASFQGPDAIQISDLSVFKSVKEISDYLMVQSLPTNLSSLSFLANLEIIAGEKTHPHKSCSLLIDHTSITSLGLKNLKTINKGNAYIKRNTNLCYVKKEMFQNMWSNSTVQLLMIGNNKPNTRCVSEGHVCSDQCSPEGCFESGDDECLSCAHFSYNGTCLPACNHTLGLCHAGYGKCQRCSEECAECNGTETTKLEHRILQLQQRNHHLEDKFRDLEEKVEKLEQSNAQHHGHEQEEQQRNKAGQGFVSFTAYPGESRVCVDGEVVQFENIVNNYGNSFNPDTSVFMCPYNGFYLFSVSVATDAGRNIDVNLMIDGSFQVGVAVINPNGLTQSATVVVSLCKAGQQVYVECQTTGHLVYGSLGRHTSFTGTLLREE